MRLYKEKKSIKYQKMLMIHGTGQLEEVQY